MLEAWLAPHVCLLAKLRVAMCGLLLIDLRKRSDVRTGRLAYHGHMKRVVVDHYGGPDVLEVVEEADPRPAPGELLVRVLAAGVSFTDAGPSRTRSARTASTTTVTAG